MKREQIIEFLKNNKDKFSKKYNIEQFILFGSVAREENSSSSDVDIIYALKDNTKISFNQYLELEKELKKAFKTKIDLINIKKLNPLIRLNAMKDFIYV